MSLTGVTFLNTGEPALFAAIDGFRVSLPTDLDWAFTAETLAGAIGAWGVATWWVWRNS